MTYINSLPGANYLQVSEAVVNQEKNRDPNLREVAERLASGRAFISVVPTTAFVDREAREFIPRVRADRSPESLRCDVGPGAAHLAGSLLTTGMEVSAIRTPHP